MDVAGWIFAMKGHRQMVTKISIIIFIRYRNYQVLELAFVC